MDKNLDALFYGLKFTVSYIDCILSSLVQVIHCPWGSVIGIVDRVSLKDSDNLSHASSTLFAAYVVMNSFGDCRKGNRKGQGQSLGSINDRIPMRWNNSSDLSRDGVLFCKNSFNSCTCHSAQLVLISRS